LKKIGVHKIAVESLKYAEASAEGATLATFHFTSLKSKPDEVIETCLYEDEETLREPALKQAWNRGAIFGETQNLARYLAESPSNLMTPTLFYQEVLKIMQKFPSIQVIAREKSWISNQRMNAFMAVAQGSEEPMLFLELHYKGNGRQDSPPIVLVGKGITFDSGGISIKPAAGMDLMKGDMSGAAVVVASLLGAAKLQLPIDLIGLIPLCENMPSGRAMKPGDVVQSMSNKTIEIENTDAEGRLILADALWYGQQQFKPRILLDLATLTGAIDVALGSCYTGVFTRDDTLWKTLEEAGKWRSDPFWRMPLHDHYKEALKSLVADIANSSSAARSGGACCAARFLQEFVDHPRWAHLDIAGVMHSQKNHSGHDHWKGMTGRPTRSILQFLAYEAATC
jgi:aminopeptidase